jgi:hypothetical protein
VGAWKGCKQGRYQHQATAADDGVYKTGQQGGGGDKEDFHADDCLRPLAAAGHKKSAGVASAFFGFIVWTARSFSFLVDF